MTYPTEIEAGLKAFASESGITTEEAAVHILREWLGARSYLPYEENGTRPEALNASNDD